MAPVHSSRARYVLPKLDTHTLLMKALCQVEGPIAKPRGGRRTSAHSSARHCHQEHLRAHTLLLPATILFRRTEHGPVHCNHGFSPSRFTPQIAVVEQTRG